MVIIVVQMLNVLFQDVGQGGNHGGNRGYRCADGHLFGDGHLVDFLFGHHNLAAGLGACTVVYLGDGSVHVDDVGLALLGLVAVATGLVDVVFESPVSDRAKLLLDTMILGLTGIEKQYGKKFLRLKFEEV